MEDLGNGSNGTDCRGSMIAPSPDCFTVDEEDMVDDCVFKPAHPANNSSHAEKNNQ
jgi:hypothetical protein